MTGFSFPPPPKKKKLTFGATFLRECLGKENKFLWCCKQYDNKIKLTCQTLRQTSKALLSISI